MRDYAELIAGLRDCAKHTCCSAPPATNLAADAFEELITKVPHWISVEERLPDDGVRVLVSCDDGVVRLNTAHDRFFDGILGKGLHGAPRLVRITHWMPLPAPPTEKVVE